MRRIDAIRVTAGVAPALRGYHVTDSDLARAASDHLPVAVEYRPADIAAVNPF
jgi:endonuclease/exonuclease/phosphatase family metal-dependent hydrolase